MRVLVTGGAGFIGSHCVDALLARGDEVLVVDDLSTGKRSNLPAEVQFAQLDISDPQLIELAHAFRPDAVSHFAAQASVVVSMHDPQRDARINILGSLNLLQAAIASGARQFVYITTGGALYGVPEYLPCDEAHPIRPTSAYGLSKWTFEQYLGILAPEGMATKVLRLANIYGPRQDPFGEAGVVAIFSDRMTRGEPVSIFGDGEQTRDFVYVQDVARAHDLALDSEQSFAVNISTNTALSVNELFRIMAGVTGYDRPPIHEAERKGELKHSALANERARQILGWRPVTAIEDGLRVTIESIQAEASRAASHSE